MTTTGGASEACNEQALPERERHRDEYIFDAVRSRAMYRGKKNRFEGGAEVLVFKTLADADEVLKLLNVKNTMSQGCGRIAKPGRGFFTFLASLNDVFSEGRAPQNGFAVAARVILSAFRDQDKPIPSILVDDQGWRTADTWPKSLHKSKIITKAEADLDRAVQADAPLTTWTERWSCRVKRSRQDDGGMSRGSKHRLAMVQLHDLKQILGLLEYTNRTREVAFSRPQMVWFDEKKNARRVAVVDVIAKGELFQCICSALDSGEVLSSHGTPPEPRADNSSTSPAAAEPDVCRTGPLSPANGQQHPTKGDSTGEIASRPLLASRAAVNEEMNHLLHGVKAIADFASFAKNGSNEALDFDVVRKGFEAAQALVDIAEAWAGRQAGLSMKPLAAGYQLRVKMGTKRKRAQHESCGCDVVVLKVQFSNTPCVALLFVRFNPSDGSQLHSCNVAATVSMQRRSGEASLMILKKLQQQEGGADDSISGDDHCLDNHSIDEDEDEDENAIEQDLALQDAELISRSRSLATDISATLVEILAMAREARSLLAQINKPSEVDQVQQLREEMLASAQTVSDFTEHLRHSADLLQNNKTSCY